MSSNDAVLIEKTIASTPDKLVTYKLWYIPCVDNFTGNLEEAGDLVADYHLLELAIYYATKIECEYGIWFSGF